MIAINILARLIRDIQIALSFATLLPVGPPHTVDGRAVAAASWAGPLAGLVIGGLGALVYALAYALALPATVAAALALSTTVMVTGALHEDGLADTADGFGGRSPAARLEIMRDSRVGTYGACALILSLGIRGCALAAIATPGAVACALMAAHAAARAGVPAFMFLVAPARRDGLSATAGAAPRHCVVVAILLGLAATGLFLGFGAALAALVLLGLAGLFLGRLALRRLGGQTGDILGAFEQIGEIAILLLAAALLRPSVVASLAV